MRLPAIRPMTPADVDALSAAFLREDWGDRRLTLDFVSRHPQAHAFVADADGAVVGSAVASVNGPVAWIGTVWVETDWRRHGIGMALTAAAIEAAHDAGCRTLLLVATDAGRRHYEKIGFEVQTTYRVLEAPGLGERSTDPRIRPYRPGDLAGMAALTSEATGEDRAHLLQAFASADTTQCLTRVDGALGGFVVRAPWGGGQTIAPRLDDGLALLEHRRSGRTAAERIRAGLVADNVAGLERLAENGWTEAWHAPRLIRGEPIAWNPDAIWGQFNFALG